MSPGFFGGCSRTSVQCEAPVRRDASVGWIAPGAILDLQVVSRGLRPAAEPGREGSSESSQTGFTASSRSVGLDPWVAQAGGLRPVSKRLNEPGSRPVYRVVPRNATQREDDLSRVRIPRPGAPSRRAGSSSRRAVGGRERSPGTAPARCKPDPSPRRRP